MPKEPVAISAGLQHTCVAGGRLKPATGPVTEPMRSGTCSPTPAVSLRIQVGMVDELYRNAGFELVMTSVWRHGRPAATLPLLFQPGSEWNYGMSTDARPADRGGRRQAAGRRDRRGGARPARHDRHRMVATPEKVDRLAAPYVPNPFDNGKVARYDDLGKFAASSRRPRSAARARRNHRLPQVHPDARRGRMESGEHLLSPETVDYMATTTYQATPT